MSDNKTSGGLTFTSLLLLAFIVLKLCDVIAWSWLWVLSPIWIPLGLAVFLYGFAQFCFYKGRQQSKKFVNQKGEIKTKWQERIDQMKVAKDRQRNQREMDEKLMGK